MDIHQQIAQAEARFGLQYKKKTVKEACGPCPWCGGEDRFLFWQEGNYLCRQCGKKGWLDEVDKPSEQEILARRVAALETKQKEQEERLTALERMARSWPIAQQYHDSLWDHGDAFLKWHEGYGISVESIFTRKLGYCPICPTAQYSPSLTIPVTRGGELFNIRHRLLEPNGSGKYMPHMAGLGAMLYNYDDVDTEGESILIVEGEIKTIVLKDRTELLIVGTMGAQGFKESWVERLDKFPLVYVCYDPDALNEASKVASWFGERGRVVVLPSKPDDMFVKHGCTADDFAGFLQCAKPV